MPQTRVRARVGREQTVLGMASQGRVKRGGREVLTWVLGVVPVALGVGIPMTIGFGLYAGVIGTGIYLSLREILYSLAAVLNEFSEAESAFD